MKEYMFNGFNINNPKNKRSKNKKSINWSTIIKVIIFTIIILIIAGFIILYQKNFVVRQFFDEYIFRKHVVENDLPTIELSIAENYHFHSFNGKIVVLNKNILTFYDKHGNIDHSLNVEITNPIFESNGKYLCIAEKGGQKVFLISDKNIVWQKDLEGNISNISVNKNGYSAIAISGTTYKTVVELIDTQGNEKFKYFLPSLYAIDTRYAIDTSISEDNKYLSIAEANLSGALIQSNIKVISIDSAIQNSDNSIVYNYIAPDDSLIIDIEYLNKNILACKFNNNMIFLNTNNNNEISEVSNFEKEKVIFADINKNIILVTSKKSAEFELQIISSNKNISKQYAIDSEPKSIQVYGNIIAVNLGSEVLFINNNGWLIKQYVSSQEIKDIVLCDDIAGIIYNNKIEILSL